MIKEIFIYVDESGTLPDPNGPVIVIAAVATSATNQLLLPKKLSTKPLSKNKTGELKFYGSGANTKRKFLTILSELDVQIFALVLEKHSQKIPDTPENFATICSLILYDCLNYYHDSLISIIFDRHFHNPLDREKFNAIIRKLTKKEINISHVDSLKEPAVNTADMVAGSLLWKQTGKDDQFYKIIKNRIVEEKIINWKEAKKWFINEKLARTGASTHPNE